MAPHSQKPTAAPFFFAPPPPPPLLTSAAGIAADFASLYPFAARVLMSVCQQGKACDQFIENFVNALCCVRHEHFCPVFISFRVGEASKEAALLQARVAPQQQGSADGTILFLSRSRERGASDSHLLHVAPRPLTAY